MKAVVVEHSEKLKLQKRMSLVDSLESSDMQCVPMCCFSALFLKRHLKSLSADQIAEVAEWERDLCVTETELVGKFLEMLQRREADLKMFNATCVEQLFSGHLKKKAMQICDLVTISCAAPGRNCRCQSKSESSRLYNVLFSRWNRFRRSQSMSRSCLSERLFWETSCHAPDCLKVYDSCMVTAWMQNLELCLSCIVLTK